MMARQTLRKPVRTVRVHGGREPKALFIVITEGEVTEPLYLKQIADGLDQLVRVKTISPNEGPIGLASAAVAALALAKEVGGIGPNDEFWCMLDVDNYGADVMAAQSIGASAGISMITSNPCFEVWILCHFSFTSAARTPSQMVAEVRRYIPAYSERAKFVPDGALDGLYATAKKHALQLDRHHDTAGNVPGSAPSTNVHRLVDALVAASLR